MAKYISRSMWNYYHIIILWRKLLVIRSRFGEANVERDAFYNLVGEDFPVATDVAAYINCVGDFIDQDGARARFRLQTATTATRYYGAAGSFGRVTAATHISFETVPSPLVALLRIRADVDFSDTAPANRVAEWNLPAGLRPVGNQANPTVQLLGWSQAELLTDTQRGILRAAGVTVGALAVSNIGNIPINELLMQSIAGYIRSSKVQCFKIPLNTHLGSLCQVPFAEKVLTDEDRVPEPDEDDPDQDPNQFLPDPNLLLTGKLMRTSSCKQFSIHVASVAATFRHRVRRYVHDPDTGVFNNDFFCYPWAVPPLDWLNNANAVFEFGLGERWNQRVFSMPEVSGTALASRYCEELRKSAARK